MIPYGRQSVDDDDVRAVVDVLRSDWLTQGPKVVEFEKALAEHCAARHAVVFANGTAALEGAYFAAGLTQGDDFVTTPLSFAATTNAALWLGAKPVFADVDPETGNLDPASAEKAVTAKTRALVPVHYAGRPVEMDAFVRLARAKGLVLIDDACHALGAVSGGRPVGCLADMSVFSFHPVKSITTGEGGAVLTSSDAYAEKLRVFRTHGVTARHPDWRYEIGFLGQNSRLTDMQCALGISQLRKLGRFIQGRREIARAYHDDLGAVPTLRLPPPSEESAWHLYPVRLRLERLKAGRAEIFRALRDAGIGVQVHYVPIYHHPLYQKMGYARGQCPAAERFYEEELSLPIFPGLTKEERRTVVRTLQHVLAGAVAA